MNTHRPFYAEALQGGLVRLAEDLSSSSPVVNPLPREGSPLSEGELEHQGLRLVLKDGKASFCYRGEVLLEEKEFAFDPLRTYVKDKIIDREHGATSSDLTAGGITLDDGVSYQKVIAFALDRESEFFALGDHVGPLSRRGYEFVNYNTDDPSDHTENKKSLYKSFPFVLISLKGHYLGICLDNTYRTLFDFMEEGTMNLAAKKGNLDLYLSVDDDPKAILYRFSQLLGRIPLIPRWALGLEQTRWGYDGEKDLKAVVDGYKKADIPLSAVLLDIDYMDGYRVFTFDKRRFPDPARFMADMKKEGIHVITIVDPGVKVDPGYPVYDELVGQGLVATLDGKTYVNEVWPGESVYPAFNDPSCEEAWGKYIDSFLKLGVSGFWNDMNEPASFRGELPPEVDFHGVSHEEMHNLYGYYMGKATAEAMKKAGKRPFIITRATFMGGQRYMVGWTGDNHSTFDSLRLLPAQLMNLGLSLFPFAGADVGGFGGDCTPELLRKWAALAVACPLFRNHSAINSKRQEPYFYDERTKEAYRNAAKLRYRLVPYLYDYFFGAAITGMPLLRPLFLEFPSDRLGEKISDEFFIGNAILAAPVLNPGPDVRSAYFPKGASYYPFAFGKKIEGGHFELVEGHPGQMPLFVREGSVVVLYPEGYSDLDHNPEEIHFRAFPGQGKCRHYVDDGDGYLFKEGRYDLMEITNDNGKVEVRYLHRGLGAYKKAIVETMDGSYEIDLQNR